ncbi:MAG: hypothetical protein R2755_09065 [Acidimicrobiales bacterium]
MRTSFGSWEEPVLHRLTIARKLVAIAVAAQLMLAVVGVIAAVSITRLQGAALSAEDSVALVRTSARLDMDHDVAGHRARRRGPGRGQRRCRRRRGGGGAGGRHDRRPRRDRHRGAVAGPAVDAVRACAEAYGEQAARVLAAEDTARRNEALDAFGTTFEQLAVELGEVTDAAAAVSAEQRRRGPHRHDRPAAGRRRPARGHVGARAVGPGDLPLHRGPDPGAAPPPRRHRRRRGRPHPPGR